MRYPTDTGPIETMGIRPHILDGPSFPLGAMGVASVATEKPITPHAFPLREIGVPTTDGARVTGGKSLVPID